MPLKTILLFITCCGSMPTALAIKNFHVNGTDTTSEKTTSNEAVSKWFGGHNQLPAPSYGSPNPLNHSGNPEPSVKKDDIHITKRLANYFKLFSNYGYAGHRTAFKTGQQQKWRRVKSLITKMKAGTREKAKSKPAKPAHPVDVPDRDNGIAPEAYIRFRRN